MGRALRMALLADRAPARMAVDIGLADRLVPDGELAAEAAAVARQLASGPTLAYAAIEDAVNATKLAGLAQALDIEAGQQARLTQTADRAEAVRAFQQGTAPTFTGR